MSLTPYLYDLELDGIPSSPDFTFEVTLTPADATTTGQLATVALHFAGGPLAHLSLAGFGVWDRPGQPHVTMPNVGPSDVYPMLDELGPGVPVTSLLRDYVLAAYDAAVADLIRRSEVR